MTSTTTLMAGATFALVTTIALSSVSAQNGAKGTSNDGVFTKAQADRASAQFTKMCADCHAFTVAGRKKPGDIVLGGPLFLKAWNGRTLDEMVTTIVMTMPSDGSGEVTEPEGLDLVAYILQQNGYPAGSAPLTKATAAGVVLRPKK
jgi:mono/diheme cytochrome c family protein